MTLEVTNAIQFSDEAYDDHSLAIEYKVLESLHLEITQECRKVTSLESAIHLLEETKTPLSPVQVQMLSIIAGNCGVHLGHRRAGLGVESYTGDRARQMTSITLEGFKERFKEILKYVIEKIKKFFEWIKNFIGKFTGSTAKKAQANAWLAEKVAKELETKRLEFKIETARRNLRLNCGDWAPTLDAMIAEIKKLESPSMSSSMKRFHTLFIDGKELARRAMTHEVDEDSVAGDVDTWNTKLDGMLRESWSHLSPRQGIGAGGVFYSRHGRTSTGEGLSSAVDRTAYESRALMVESTPPRTITYTFNLNRGPSEVRRLGEQMANLSGIVDGIEQMLTVTREQTFLDIFDREGSFDTDEWDVGDVSKQKIVSAMAKFTMANLAIFQKVSTIFVSQHRRMVDDAHVVLKAYEEAVHESGRIEPKEV